MKRTLLWIQLVFASIVVLGVFLQVYLIASYAMGAGEEALDAHGFVGGVVVHLSELIVFLVGIGAWWRIWSWLGWSFGLFVLGTVQIFLLPPDEDPASGWVHGLHGLLALFVMLLAAAIALRDARALGLTRRGGDEIRSAPPPAA